MENIKKIDILLLAESLGCQKLKKVGNIFQGTFRSEETPAVTFYPETNSYCDFANTLDPVGGSVIDLVMAIKNSNVKEAVHFLSDYSGIKPIKEYNKNDLKLMKRKASNNEIYLQFLKSCLPMAEEGFEYFSKRGIEREMIIESEIGYCKSYKAVSQMLFSLFGQEKIKESGLTSFFYNFGINEIPFIVIPYFHNNEIVFLQGRSITFQKGKPKYVNIKASPCMYLEKNHNDKFETTIVCEGVIDTISVKQMLKKEGIENFGIVGLPSINGLNKEEIPKISKGEVIFALDNDEVSKTKLPKLQNQMMQENYKTSFLEIPYELNGISVKDMNDFLVAKGSIKDLFEKRNYNKTNEQKFSSLIFEKDEWFNFFEDITNKQGNNGITGISSGYKYFDQVCNGIPSGLFILTGEPSCGKTTFVKQIADQVLEKNKNVACLFISLEQSKEELRVKTLSRLSGIDNTTIFRGQIDSKSDDYTQLANCIASYYDVLDRFSIIEGTQMTTINNIQQNVRDIKKWCEVENVLLIIDYLQILPAPEIRTNTMKDKVDHLVSELRRLARSEKISIIAISSQNRGGYNRKSLSVLKESGGIEYGADVVGIITTEKISRNSTCKSVTLNIAKNRNGEKASINYNFYPKICKFIEKSKSDYDEENE